MHHTDVECCRFEIRNLIYINVCVDLIDVFIISYRKLLGFFPEIIAVSVAVLPTSIFAICYL